MIKTLLAASSAAALAAIVFTPAPSDARQMRPQGSYLSSCSDVSVRGDVLSATCRDSGRNTRASSLNISRCRGADISNSNGLLVCGSQRGEWQGGGNNNGGGRPGGGSNWGGGNSGGGNNGGGWGNNQGGGWGNNGRAPNGSYQTSCNDISVRGDRLYATCRDVGRNQRASSLDLNRCRGVDIANSNGLLICGSQRGEWERGNSGGGGRPGWGNRQPSITVYKDSNFRGERATFQGDVNNLGPTGFNDAISSMEMRGPWEVCTDSNFRGSCQIFEGDERNLGSTGYNDRISSMRPVRGW